MWDDEQIDAAIDETARQMTAGEPGADFRARVMARIDSRPRAMAMWRPALAVLSVAAMLVIGLVFLREQPRPQTSAPPEVRLTPDSTAKPDEVRPKSNAGAGVDVAQGLSRALAADTLRVRPRPDATYDLEPLTTAALELETIAVAAMAPDDSIHIEPLPPAPSIAVTPLGVDNEGDRR